MGRPVTAALEVYGAVRIVARGARYRILWSEDGSQQELSATTIETARQHALTVSGRLVAGERTRKDTEFKHLIVKALLPETGNRGERCQELYDGLARNHIIPALGDRRCRNLHDTDVRKFLHGLAAEGYSNSTIKHTMKVLNLAVRQGVREGVWEPMKHPMYDVSAPRATGRPADLAPVPRSAVPSDSEVSRFLAAMTQLGTRFELMTKLSAATGLRWGELMGLRISDVDFEAGVLHVVRAAVEHKGHLSFKTPKTDAGVRDVPIPTRGEFACSDELRAFVAGRKAGELVFAGRTGQPMRRTNFSRKFRQAADAAAFPERFTWHSLRHYAATRMLRLGVSLADVSATLGHANVAITQRLYVGGDAETIDRVKAIL
jgi:integrase